MAHELEIIPLVHNVGVNAHSEIVNYVSNLPNGTTIILEISESKLNEFINRLYRQNTHLFDHFESRSHDWAFFEIVYACLKRGIKILPLEPDYLTISGLNRLRRVAPQDKGLAVIAQDHYREKVMLLRTLKYAKGSKVKKLFLLVGAGHVANLKKYFSGNISVSVNLDLFSSINKPFIERSINDGPKLTEALRLRNMSLARRLYEEQENLVEKMPKEDYFVRNATITRKTADFARNKKERTQRNLVKRK